MTDKSKHSYACPDFHRTTEISRRTLLKAGGMGLMGLTMPKLLRAAESPRAVNIPKRAKSVIFLFQWGGPSHIDMFDLKPDAPDGIRSPHGSIKSAVPGLHVNEHMPKTAKIMDKVTLIRSMTHEMTHHNSAGYYALTGHEPPSNDQRLRDSPELWPAYGSIVDKLAPNEDEMPTFVSYPHTIADGADTPGQNASFLGRRHDPLFIGRDPNSEDFGLPELSLPQGLDIDRLQSRRGLQEVVNQQAHLLDHAAEAQGLDEYYKRALAMLHSERVREAFNLEAEPEEMRDAYGRTDYGQSCLLARRLVEAGVKFVTVYFSRSIGGQSKTSGGWDTHGFNDTRMFPIIEERHLPITEQTLPTLLYDLEDRGMLDDTLVIWMGEFGRTPRINNNESRDHWPQCYSTLLAGGGVKRGYIHGASDKHAMYPDRDPVRPDDLAATVYHLLGIDHEAEVTSADGRPLFITNGQPVHDVIA